MLLLFWLIKYAKLFHIWVSCFVTEKHVARVSKICCSQHRWLMIKIDNATCARSNFIISSNWIDQQFSWRYQISIITSFIQRRYNLTQSLTINSRIDSTFCPSTYTISNTKHRISDASSIFTSLISLIIMWINMQPSVENIVILLTIICRKIPILSEDSGSKNHSLPWFLVCSDLVV